MKLTGYGGAFSRLLLLVSANAIAHASQAQQLPSPAEESPEPEIVYHESVSVDEDGFVVDALQMGSTVVTLADGGLFQVDSGHLRDPDGNRYAIEGGLSQPGPEEPVTIEVTVLRYTPVYVTWEQALDEYLEQVPDATEEQIETFHAQWSDPLDATELATHVDEAVMDWSASADADDLLEVAVVLRENPRLELPKVPNHLLVEEPALWLAAMEARLLAIEERKVEMLSLQQDLVSELEMMGAEIRHQGWAVNGLGIRVTPAAAEFLATDERVASLQLRYDDTLAINEGGEEVRERTQTWMYWDENYIGDTGGTHSRVYGAVVDNKIDIGHPAWMDDDQQNSRLLGTWRYDEISGWETVTVSSTRLNWSDSHGNLVSSNFLADLSDNQDPSVTVTTEQLSKSAQSPEAYFSFLEWRTDDDDIVDYDQFVEQLLWLNVDIANFSIGCSAPGCQCMVGYFDNSAVDTAYWNDIFMVQAAGNEGHFDQGGACDGPYAANDCNVRAQATASGAFVVGAMEKDEDLFSPDILCDAWDDGSCRGGDLKDRPIIKIVAPSGWNGEHNARLECSPMGCVHGYHEQGEGTSYAAPMVAGAAADLKDFLLTHLLLSTADDVALQYATMLLMGDGKLEAGTQTATTPIDELWGVGRMRMRLFTPAGMDAPWRWGFKIVELDHGQVIDQPLNFVRFQGNQPIPSEAEWLRAALWFWEPNLEASQNTSEIKYIAWNTQQQYYPCSSVAPQSQRLWMGNVLGGKTWSLRMYGQYIPAGDYPEPNVDPYDDDATRKVCSAFYWEERDWDDPDGPGPNDNIR